MSMTRADAISHMLYLSQTVAGEFCINAEEFKRSDQETDDALLALGVTPAELLRAQYE